MFSAIDLDGANTLALCNLCHLFRKTICKWMFHAWANYNPVTMKVRVVNLQSTHPSADLWTNYGTKSAHIQLSNTYPGNIWSIFFFNLDFPWIFSMVSKISYNFSWQFENHWLSPDFLRILRFLFFVRLWPETWVNGILFVNIL